MLKKRLYQFSGKDEEGIDIKGIIDAPNKAIARYMLLKIGLKKINYLIITLSSCKKLFTLSLKDKLHLFSHLSLQINSGISILDSLNNIKLDTHSFKLKYLLFIILKNLNEGHRLSLSLTKIEYSPFSENETSLIRASEISGSLESTLEFICDGLKNKLIIKQKIVSSLIYPCMTMAVSFVVIFIIFKWVIPQFELMFYKSKHNLPWLTELVFYFSNNITLLLTITLCSLLLSSITIKLLIKKKILSELISEKLILIIPIFGKILIMTNRINFCYTLSMLLSAGVSIHDALNETNKHITLPYSRRQFKQALNDVIAGKSISTALKKTQFFPRSAIQTIASAENSGRLDQAFKIISQQFYNDLSVFSDHVGKIIEPFIIILLGGIIGMIVIAIYLPIFQLGSLY